MVEYSKLNIILEILKYSMVSQTQFNSSNHIAVSDLYKGGDKNKKHLNLGYNLQAVNQLKFD